MNKIRHNDRKKLKAFFILLGLFLLMLGLSYLSKGIVNIPAVETLVKTTGLFGPIILIISVAIGGIIIPLSGLPFLMISIPVYGFWLTFLIYYLGNTVIAPTVDFYLARHFGRPLIKRLFGKKSLEEIDKIATELGWHALVPLRIFGGILHDSISYAAGLTNMPPKKYFIISFLLPIPGQLLTLYILYNGIHHNSIFLGVIVVWGYLAGLLTPYFIYKYKKKRGRE
jgi:uncharacterized membrane protein YdjX (TVP38/TMEM64 family)